MGSPTALLWWNTWFWRVCFRVFRQAIPNAVEHTHKRIHAHTHTHTSPHEQDEIRICCIFKMSRVHSRQHPSRWGITSPNALEMQKAQDKKKSSMKVTGHIINNGSCAIFIPFSYLLIRSLCVKLCVPVCLCVLVCMCNGACLLWHVCVSVHVCLWLPLAVCMRAFRKCARIGESALACTSACISSRKDTIPNHWEIEKIVFSSVWHFLCDAKLTSVFRRYKLEFIWCELFWIKSFFFLVKKTEKISSSFVQNQII